MQITSVPYCILERACFMGLGSLLWYYPSSANVAFGGVPSYRFFRTLLQVRIVKDLIILVVWFKEYNYIIVLEVIYFIYYVYIVYEVLEIGLCTCTW